MAIQAFTSAFLAAIGWIRLEAGQQAIAGVLFLLWLVVLRVKAKEET